MSAAPKYVCSIRRSHDVCFLMQHILRMRRQVPPHGSNSLDGYRKRNRSSLWMTTTPVDARATLRHCRETSSVNSTHILGNSLTRLCESVALCVCVSIARSSVCVCACVHAVPRRHRRCSSFFLLTSRQHLFEQVRSHFASGLNPSIRHRFFLFLLKIFDVNRSVHPIRVHSRVSAISLQLFFLFLFIYFSFKVQSLFVDRL